MNCQSVQDRMVEYLLHELNEQDRANVDQHIASGCEACQSELAMLLEGVEGVFESQSADELSEADASDICKIVLQNSRLPLARTNQATAHEAVASTGTRSTAQSNTAKLNTAPRVLQALLAIAAGYFLMLALPLLPKDLDSAPPNPNAIGDLGSTIPFTPNRDISLVSFNSSKWQPTGNGYFFVDALSHEVHLISGGLSELPAGEEYVLLVSTQEEDYAYPVNFSAGGHGKLVFPLPKLPITNLTLKTRPMTGELPSANQQSSSTELDI